MINHGPKSHCDKDCLNMTMVNDGQPWSKVTLWQRLSQYENQPWSTMVNHCQPWSNAALWQRLSQHENQPLSMIIINHGHIVTNIVSIWKSTMVQRRIMKKIISIWKSIMVNHGPMSHCDKDCLNMKSNHGQPCLF